MTGRAATGARGGDPTHRLDGTRIAALLAVAFVALIVVRALAELGAPGAGGPAASAGAGVPGSDAGASASATASTAPSIPVDAFLDPVPRPAPELTLTGPDGVPVSLADMRGTPVLVFFGYTHCPDVCPATIGVVGQAIDATGGAARAIFVSVDPERDTVEWLTEFVRYMPAGFTAVTGTDAEVRETADAWGVRYARVEEADPAAYSMSHTADVFVIDGAGRYRASLPFGTDAETMTAVIRRVEATTPAATSTPTPAPSATAAPTPGTTAAPTTAEFMPVLISSAIWAGGDSPVILKVHGPDGRINDLGLEITVQLLSGDGTPQGSAVPALTVRPDGLDAVSYVADLDVPTPGMWTARVTGLDRAGTRWSGLVGMMVRDPGATPAIGGPAPDIRTPTAGDFGGDATWVTTDPLPDPRLSDTSTVDALAAGRPFVLVVDSYRFKVTPACGTSIFLSKGLLDRWGSVDFIHHEPYRYTVVTTEPVLEGTLAKPFLTEAAEAWGIGVPPWGTASMPWLFVVDGDGIVRAKYQGVVGSADVDVILTVIAGES